MAATLFASSTKSSTESKFNKSPVNETSFLYVCRKAQQGSSLYMRRQTPWNQSQIRVCYGCEDGYCRDEMNLSKNKTYPIIAGVPQCAVPSSRKHFSVAMQGVLEPVSAPVERARLEKFGTILAQGPPTTSSTFSNPQYRYYVHAAHAPPPCYLE